MIYLIWTILGVLSFLKKDNKFISFFVFVFILCIFSFNTTNPDLENYIDSYNGVGVHYTEPIFLLLENIVSTMGFDYVLFRFFVVLSCLCLIVKTIYKYSPYPTFVLFLYTIYPMSVDVVQIRFFIGYSIVLFATGFLLDYQRKKNFKYIIFFILLIAIASGIHYGCVLYSILGLMFLDLNKHKFFYLFFLPFVYIIFVTYLYKLVPVISFVIGEGKLYRWVEKGIITSGLATLRILVNRFMPLLLSLFITYLARSVFFNTAFKKKVPVGVGMFFSNSLVKFDWSNNIFFDFRINRCLFVCVYYISLFSILEITKASSYDRLGRLGLLLAAILISRQLYYLNNYNKLMTQVLFLLMFIIYFLLIMCFLSVASDSTQRFLYFDAVFRQVMENNSLIF